MRVSAILGSANHLHPKMPFEIPSKGDHIPLGRIDQTYEKMICIQALLALKTDPSKEGYAMTNYLHRFDKCFAAFLCLLFLAFCVITCSIQTKAQTALVGVSRTNGVVSSSPAYFIYSPSSPVEGQVVYFTDISRGSPTSWQWNFGDGTTSTSKNPSHAYATAGSYAVTLTLTDSSGSNSTSQTVITVRPAFAASFTYSPSLPAVGQAVQFTDTSTGGSPTSWQWDFGDSATSTIQNPSHAYAAAGSYWVNLIITKGTNSNSTNQILTVREPGIIRAASPSYADVSAAVNYAVSGDTIIVPAGPAIWDNHLIITKGIYLIGAGIGNTIITGNYAHPDLNNWNPENYLISYVPTSPALNEPFRLSGFTFNVDNKCFGLLLRNATLNVLNKIRIDHTRWYNVPNENNHAIFNIYGTIYGVADNNIFDGGGEMRWGSLDGQCWTNLTFDFGTADNFYLEDNTIYCHRPDFFYWDMGSRGCVRYNTIYANDYPSGYYPLLDLHGSGGPGAHPSVMGAEFYSNTIIAGNRSIEVAFRGGKALYYNNEITTSGYSIITFREEYLDSINPPANGPTGQPQHVSDTYVWGNTKSGSIITRYSPFWPLIDGTIDYGGNEGVVPTENKHFWINATSFDGTAGVGVGPLSARPTTCTKGVAYWATDQNILYKATANNVWTAYYQPYTYPHPLRRILN